MSLPVLSQPEPNHGGSVFGSPTKFPHPRAPVDPHILAPPTQLTPPQISPLYPSGLVFVFGFNQAPSPSCITQPHPSHHLKLSTPPPNKSPLPNAKPPPQFFAETAPRGHSFQFLFIYYYYYYLLLVNSPYFCLVNS